METAESVVFMEINGSVVGWR